MGAAEAEDLERCCARLAALVEAGPPPKEGALAWNRPRLDRILADHMLRHGYYASAERLASERGIQARTLNISSTPARFPLSPLLTPCSILLAQNLGLRVYALFLHTYLLIHPLSLDPYRDFCPSFPHLPCVP